MSSDPILQSLLASADALALDTSAVSAPPGPAGPFGVPNAGGLGGVSSGEGTVPVSVKSFSVVVIDCSDDTVCFGSVGAGGSICVRSKCGIKSHTLSKSKFAGRSAAYAFIQRGIPGSVFSEPHLEVRSIPRGVLDEWGTQRRSLMEWNLEFQAVEATDDSTATSEEIKEEASFLARADKVRTPSKKRREMDEIMESDFVILGWRGESYQKVLPEEGSVELENQIQGGFKKGVVTRAVAGIESKLESMSKGMVELSQLSHNRFISIEESIRVCGGIVQTLRSKIGKEVSFHERFEAPTLWGTTSFISDDLTRVDEEVAMIMKDIEPLKETISILKTRFNDSESTKDATDKLVKIVTIIMTKVQSLTPEISSIRADMESLKVSVSNNNLSGTRMRQGADRGVSGVRETKDTLTYKVIPSAVDDLMSLVCDNSEDGGGGDELSCTTPISNHAGGLRTLSTNGGRAAALKPNVPGENWDNSAILRQLVDDVRSLKSGSEETSIKFGNLGFRNIHECSRWIEENFSCMRYGLIMDPLVMLERIYGDDEVDAVSLLKTLESRLKLKIETGAEASALNALRHSRPRIFHKGRPTMVNLSNKSRLNLLPSHADWKSGGEGVKAFIVHKMNILHASIASDISFELGRHPSTAVAQMVATMSLTATITFITQLLGMVDAIYERLFSLSKFSSDQAWSLTTQVLDRVLSDLYAPKDGIGESLTTRSPLSICAHLMWCSFRTHDVMSQYVLHNFEDHPAVSTEYVKFLATNSGSDKVAKLGDQVEAMKIKVTSATDEAKKAVSKADTASTKNADLVREVAALTKRLKALEDKAGR